MFKFLNDVRFKLFLQTLTGTMPENKPAILIQFGTYPSRYTFHLTKALAENDHYSIIAAAGHNNKLYQKLKRYFKQKKLHF